MGGSSDPVLIAGAGIGGLCLSLALARRGVNSLVLEREFHLDEAGAGIQLSPNACHVLFGIGLEAAIRAMASEPSYLRIRNGRSGKQLAELPLGATTAQRYGAPYLVIHRADLQAVLLDAARSQPLVALRTGETVLSYEQEAACIFAVTASGQYRGKALVGADGLRSTVRQQLVGDGPAAYAGYYAWRGLVQGSTVDSQLLDATGLWFGSGGHLVHYPIRAGRMLNVVAIVSAPAPMAGDHAGHGPDDGFFGWSASARSILDQVNGWSPWPLHDRPPDRHWCDGRATLLGDAAHPMLPFLAQGGAMAIEDAAVLATYLAGAADVAAALAAYAAARQNRTARVQLHARANGRIYHLPHMFARARDLVLAARSPAALAQRQDWIYRWRPETVPD